MLINELQEKFSQISDQFEPNWLEIIKRVFFVINVYFEIILNVLTFQMNIMFNYLTPSGHGYVIVVLLIFYHLVS